jgi:serine/threonine protein kinase/tetratricopeptide (TPR) repeat protein
MLIERLHCMETILCTAVEISDSHERAAYLDRACGDNAVLRQEVEQMVRNHFRAGLFLEHPSSSQPAIGRASMLERPGDLIGRYKLLEQIGEGGMGTVYMAEQVAPVRRKVALKIIKPGMDSRQIIGRFEAERQALALMDHPNIARVFDGGETAGGRPYFVMELVCGMPITEFCDHVRLTPRNRLQLLLTVCQAVHHAHQKGIIHRDLKPSNVLVTLHDSQPVAKVIDFGIAKAICEPLTDKTLFTAFAQMVGTPLYMSPEQAEMSGIDVDTRSDVYSLGVLCYELLTGRTPFGKDELQRAGFDEMRRIIREEEPMRPSHLIGTLKADDGSTVSQRRGIDQRQLTRELHGELDWIVMKALETDRSRRYQSASALAADIQHYLNNEPVDAGPPSTLYRFRKIVQRHKAAFVSFAAVALALVIGAGISLWQAAEAVRQHHRAERNYLTARQAVARMLTQVADERLGEVRELKDLRRTLLDDAVKFYTKLIKSSPGDAKAHAERAEAASLLWGHRAAITDYERAVALDPNNAEYHEALADLYSRGSGMSPNRIKAFEHSERAIELDSERLMPYWYQATALGQLGRPDEARAVFDKFEKLSPPICDTYVRLASGFCDIGDLESARQFGRKAIKLDPTSFDAHGTLASVLISSGETEEALREANEAIRLSPYRLSRWGSSAYVVRGHILVKKGQYADALDDLGRAIDLEPWWFFPYSRRAVAHFYLKQYGNAFADLLKASELYPAAN